MGEYKTNPFERKHKSYPNDKYCSVPELMMALEGEIKPMSVEGSDIVEFYKDKTVLVTGATGFLGQLLVDKLLRTCNDIKKIYIVVRSKKGVDVDSRINQMFNDVVFSPLRKMRPNFQDKISIMEGDLEQENLGLSFRNIRLIQENVNIIYHLAATVHFIEEFSRQINKNVRGTRDLLIIAKECTNLESYVHCSTAYSNSNRHHIEETIYPPIRSADSYIELANSNIAKEELIEIEKEETKGWPNSYAFTKQVAENAVKTYGNNLPICIFRPAIVAPTYREPLKSWTNNFYGPTTHLIGMNDGFVHIIHADREIPAMEVPADYVINCMIKCSHEIAIKKFEKIPVYNYILDKNNIIKWTRFLDYSKFYGTQTPTTKCIWYSSYYITTNVFLYRIGTYLLHYLPGLLMDLLLVLSRKKPMMYKLYKRITKLTDIFDIFNNYEWLFDNNNVRNLWESTSSVDKNIFPFDMSSLDWNDYMVTFNLGVRTYLLKEDPATIPAARRKYGKFKIAHYILKSIFYLLIIKIVYCILKYVYKLYVYI